MDHCFLSMAFIFLLLWMPDIVTLPCYFLNTFYSFNSTSCLKEIMQLSFLETVYPFRFCVCLLGSAKSNDLSTHRYHALRRRPHPSYCLPNERWGSLVCAAVLQVGLETWLGWWENKDRTGTKEITDIYTKKPESGGLSTLWKSGTSHTHSTETTVQNLSTITVYSTRAGVS